MGMNRDDIFKRAMERRQKEKQEQEQKRGSGGNTFSSFEQVSYTALEKDQMSVVRILGVPMRMRDSLEENGQFSPKQVNYAMIVGDSGKKFRCIFPSKEEEPSWIMWRILDKVLSGKWDRESNQRVFDHAGSQVFEMVHKNGVNREASSFIYNMEKGWYPTKAVVMNVIDRSRMDWHKSEKKTCVLSKKVNTGTNKKGETTYFYEVGIPLMLYNMIIDEIVEAKGDFEGYDVGIVKRDSNPWYDVFYLPTVDPDLIRKYGDVNLQYAKTPLTEEERLYKQWDLDAVYPVTSYTKLKNRLSAKIQMIDKQFGTNFLEELEELAIKEKTERESKTANSNAQKEFDPDEIEADIEDSQSEEKPQTRPSRKPKKTEVASTEFDISSLDPDVYVGVENLESEMINKIVGVHPNGELEYDLAPNEQIYACSECDFKSPESFTHCPKCGVEFD